MSINRTYLNLASNFWDYKKPTMLKTVQIDQKYQFNT